ncbi:MAG: ABC transporter permease [Bacillota bacterium]
MTKKAIRIYQSALIFLITTLSIYAYWTGLIDYMVDNRAQLLKLVYQHLILVSSSMTIAIILGMVIGIILSRPQFKKYQGVTLYIVGLGQTIPSLAVLALAMSILGIGRGPAIFALTIYSVLPIARNTLAGLNAIADDLLDAARGMGLSNLRILWEIELPNALKVILTGIRMAVVINIGTAALGALVGAGGLGDQIFTGISFLDTKLLLSGAIPTALLALLADYSLQLLENILLSEGLKLDTN